MTWISQRIALGVCLATTVGVAEAHSASPLRVRLMMEMREPDDWISGLTWAAMMTECRRIWRAEHVEVVGERDTSSADVTIPLISDHRRLRHYDSSSARAFGLTVFRGRARQILISAPRARQAARQDPLFALSGSTGLELQSIMGHILGRVVAHEVGHVLLLKAEHGTVGLMRPHMDVRELLRGDETQFALTPQERALLTILFPNRYPPGHRTRTSQVLPTATNRFRLTATV